MAIQIKLKNSVVQDSTPSTSDLPAVGEIALNANINSIGGFMRASDNTIVKIFGPGSLSTPTATTTVSGISELATNSETTTGTATNRVVTPAGLNAVTVAERTTSNTNYVAKAGSTLTGVLTMPNGSNSAPAINFGDSDSGIFGGTNTVSLAAGGTTRLTADTGVSVVGTLAVTGAITSTSDLTIADKIIHAGDTNTAVRFPAADTVSVETGGSEALRVDSSQRLLVGHTSPIMNFRFEVAGIDGGTSGIATSRFSNNTSPSTIILSKSRGATVGSYTVLQDNDQVGVIDFRGSDGTDSLSQAAIIRAEIDGTPGSNDMPGRLVFGTTADGAASPTERLRIDSSGKVGIGTTAPNSELVVQGAAHSNLQVWSGSASTKGFIQTVQDSEIRLGGSTNHPVTLYQNSLERMRIDSDGKVAIGTSTTSMNGNGLKIFHANFPSLQLQNNATGTGATVGAEFILSSGGVLQLVQRSSEAMIFKTANDEKMRIDSSGNVGIGTTNPSSLFTVSDGNQGFEVAPNSSSTVRLLAFDRTNSVRKNLRIDALAYEIQCNNGTEKIRIDSSGRLLVGTTASLGVLGLAAQIQVAGDTAGESSLALRRFGNSAQGAFLTFSKSRNAADGSRTIVQNGDELGRVTFCADDGTDLATGAAEIRANVDGTPGANDTPGRLVFLTTADGSATLSERMRINSSGNVGIGTSSPSYRIDVKRTDAAGDYAYFGASSDGGARGLEFSSSDTGIFLGAIHTINATSGGGVLAFATGSSERMRIDSSGNVGIGATSPSATVHILNDDPQLRLQRSGSHSTSAGPLIQFQGRGPNTVNYNFAKIQAVSSGSNNAGELQFFTNTGGNQDERLRIDSSGNVGIGTTSPDQTLHVHKGSAGSVSSASSSVLTLENSSHVTLQFLTPNDTAAQLRFGDPQDNGAGFIEYNHTNNALTFGTNGPEKMRIDSSGKVGIGTTSPDRKLHVAGSFIRVDDGYGLDTSGSTEKIVLDDGFVAFHVGSERMRINSSGDVGIGTTSPTTGLHVNGTARVNQFLVNTSTVHNSGRVTIKGHSTGSHTNIRCTDSSDNQIFLVRNDNHTFVGTLSKSAGSFFIDHPLPSLAATKTLRHSFIEGPQCDNIYRGKVTLSSGTASINLDTVSKMTEGTFVVLNRDVQCFTTNETGFDSVKGFVENNILTIVCENNSSTDTISWMVVGERQDPSIKTAGITDDEGYLLVEEDKVAV